MLMLLCLLLVDSRGKELNWYLYSGALGWHMRGAWSRPLTRDEQACSWLYHTSPQVVVSAVRAMPLQEQSKLAAQLAENDGDIEKAARVLYNIIDMCDLPREEIRLHATRLFEFVDRIPMKERSSHIVRYESTVAFKLYYAESFTTRSELALDRLMQLADGGATLEHTPT